MSIDSSHTGPAGRDAARASALFFAALPGLKQPVRRGPFWMEITDDGANNERTVP
ncbi:hypothetical protein IGS74_02795 [Aureimonas sp. OT7]|uniref:hypothetical protein n=1 Tax=Aureimonas TaxID=414371 RepID=UPI00177CD5A2|nr:MULTISPECIES: hypothetical protein [Aureimonas]QOG07213.1 hypothetical protein IGS74_02795 [Aureimonas sp. OT7]